MDCPEGSNESSSYKYNNGGPSISGRGGSHENNYYDRYNMYGSSYGGMNDSYRNGNGG